MKNSHARSFSTRLENDYSAKKVNKIIYNSE